MCRPVFCLASVTCETCIVPRPTLKGTSSRKEETVMRMWHEHGEGSGSQPQLMSVIRSVADCLEGGGRHNSLPPKSNVQHVDNTHDFALHASTLPQSFFAGQSTIIIMSNICGIILVSYTEEGS